MQRPQEEARTGLPADPARHGLCLELHGRFALELENVVTKKWSDLVRVIREAGGGVDDNEEL